MARAWLTKSEHRKLMLALHPKEPGPARKRQLEAAPTIISERKHTIVDDEKDMIAGHKTLQACRDRSRRRAFADEHFDSPENFRRASLVRPSWATNARSADVAWLGWHEPVGVQDVGHDGTMADPTAGSAFRNFGGSEIVGDDRSSSLKLKQALTSWSGR